jgi:porphobilinogen synthase
MTRLERSGNSVAGRPRRLRTNSAVRELVAETGVHASQLIAPFFTVAGADSVQPVASLPGVSRLGVNPLLRELERALRAGLKGALLFGVVADDHKDEMASSANDPAGPVPQALRAARREFGDDLVLFTDVCLCGHASHGHCGLLRNTARGVVVDNDSSLERLAEMALVHARAGADFVAPSDMMDGRVGYLRAALDAAGLTQTGIMSYAVKYASAFYGPFRDAAGSAPGSGDRSSYQMDCRNVREAVREAGLDSAEGADILMVKPALAYLDVIRAVREQSSLPLAAYSVSGEYAMIRAAAAAGVLDEGAAVRESLLAMRRAGADLIISYHAITACEQGWTA